MNLSYGENKMSDLFFPNFSFFGEKYYIDSVCPQVKMCLCFSPLSFPAAVSHYHLQNLKL